MNIQLSPLGIVLFVLAILVLVGVGALLGAALVESDQKRTRSRPRLMRLCPPTDRLGDEEEVVDFRPAS